jgi:predicted acyltransferase
LIGLETRQPTDFSANAPGVFVFQDHNFTRPWTVPATWLAFAGCALGAWLTRRPGTAAEQLYHALWRWGTYWLVLGLVFEPYEGGIRKDHPTMSYYFVTAGLAHWMLIAFSIVIDRFRQGRWLQLLVDNGQNPMIAYAGINNFITPVLALTSLLSWSAQWATTPWLGFARGLAITLLMALTVSWLTRRKIFWRT